MKELVKKILEMLSRSASKNFILIARQRCILNPIEHLQLLAVNCFRKKVPL